MTSHRRLMTQAEYARHRNVSRAAVSQAIKAGRITPIEGKIDREVADIQWGLTQTELRSGGAATAGGEPRPGADSAQSEPTFLQAKARREQALAELAELELAERQGLLVPAEQVRNQCASVAVQIRESLLAMADRLAPLVAPESDQQACHRLVIEDVRRTLQALTGDFAR